jgi:lipoprotein-anchoring transpeptidase ErfK/SrfK
VPKKLKKKTVSRVKQSKSPVGFFFYKRIIIVSMLAALFLTGLFALTQSREWYFFTTGKEQFVSYDPSQSVGFYEGKVIPVPPVSIAYNVEQEKDTVVLGDADVANKKIEVDLTNQRVYAFENGNKVYDFLISSGKYGRTPTGEFTIERRVPVQSMIGGNKALGTYYNLPGVRYVQYFGNTSIPWWKGFSFHSTYWHNNFGHPMSHGCINMTLADSEALWNWTGQTGVKVVIYGTTPAS